MISFYEYLIMVCWNLHVGIRKTTHGANSTEERIWKKQTSKENWRRGKLNFLTLLVVFFKSHGNLLCFKVSLILEPVNFLGGRESTETTQRFYPKRAVEADKEGAGNGKGRQGCHWGEVQSKIRGKLQKVTKLKKKKWK